MRPGAWLRFSVDLGRPLVLRSALLHVLFLVGPRPTLVGEAAPKGYAGCQRQEPRNLVAAYKFYCGKDLTNAHSADADTMATYEVLMAQLEKYDIPVDVDGLAEFTAGNARLADFAGRIAYDAQGVEIFNFGKYKGLRVADVFRRDPGYYGWIQNGDFPQYTKNVFTRVYLSLRK